MINKDDYKLSSDGKTLIEWRNSSMEDLDMNMEEQLKNVIEIGSQAFVRSNLKTLVISKNAIKIGKSAFAGCSSLISVVIPENIIEIECYTFDGCTSLISITIPQSIKK